jgi:hypothetical protein
MEALFKSPPSLSNRRISSMQSCLLFNLLLRGRRVHHQNRGRESSGLHVQEGLLNFPHSLSPAASPASELLVTQVQKGGDSSRIIAIMDERNDDFGTVPVIDADEVGGLRGMLGQDLGQLLGGWMAAYDAWEIKSYPAKGKLKACR